MQHAMLMTREGSVPLRIAFHEDRWLLECFAPRGLLEHLRVAVQELPSTAFVRGVVDPARGAHFDLMDRFGVIQCDVCELDASAAEALLSELGR